MQVIRFKKTAKVLVIIFIVLILFLWFFFHQRALNKINTFNEVKAFNDLKVSWENEVQIAIDALREGPGEQGRPVNISEVLTDPIEIKENEELFKIEGFYVKVSDKISLNRSLPDHRPQACKSKKYWRNLPKVSIIIVFHNEIWSILLRCIHSIYNRSPPELLHEIVLVDDGSTFVEYEHKLEEYIKRFNGLVKLHYNEKREGLIRARVIGAKLAEAKAILFLDSHMEVGYNWLPPMLDPLVDYPNYATAALAEGFDHATFAYNYVGNGYRGLFDWNFRYQWLPRRPQDKGADDGENFELPILTGNSWAILKDHFFHLGAFDENLKIWNAENYEISLKLWLCSGGIFHVPCSRIIHLSKMSSAYRKSPDGFDFSTYNLKRVAEVWLDDYKKYVYRGDPERYARIDAGDLSKQFELKKKLNCKPFKYYLDRVAPEFLEYYPLEPQYFARGSIQNLESKLCLARNDEDYFGIPILAECNDDLVHPDNNLEFIFTFENSIKYNDTNDQCMGSTKMTFSNCNHQKYDQFWFYDENQMQIYDKITKKCLTGGNLNEEIFLSECDDEKQNQKWTFGEKNQTAFDNLAKTS